MLAPTVAKTCVVPVCGSTKFNLVHKFPADKERFDQWIEAISLNGERTVTKLENLTPDAVRKRYFVCARHFTLSEYKHSASRSLNLTAVPKLNLRSVEDIGASKAGQLENNGEVTEEVLEKAKAASSQQIKILNAGSAKITLTQEPAQFSQVSMPSEEEINQIVIDESYNFEEPPVKRVKRNQATTAPKVYVKEKSPVKVVPVHKAPIKKIAKVFQKTSPKSKQAIAFENAPAKPIPATKLTAEPRNDGNSAKTETLAENPVEEAKPTNKLLALIEVTPDQYEKLSKSLSAAERSENVESLINLIDKDDERDPQAADNGKNLPRILELAANLSLYQHVRWATCEL